MNKKYTPKVLYMLTIFLVIIFCSFTIIRCHCGELINESLDDCPDKYAKPSTHEEKIDMIMNNLEEKNESVVQLYIDMTPVELRMVDYNKDEKKDLILLVGIPYAQSINVGTITLYLVDHASNGFGKIDITKVGKDINGYLLLEEQSLDQEKMNAVNLVYENAIDLAADVILFIDQVKEIQKQRGLDKESLKKRSGDEIISGEVL